MNIIMVVHTIGSGFDKEDTKMGVDGDDGGADFDEDEHHLGRIQNR